MKKRNFFILAAACTLCCLNVYAQGGDMQITSPEFAHNESIPALFTCQGDDINPALEISGVPEEARTFVLIVDDPDAPGATWDHWIVWNMPAGTVRIEQDSVPGEQGTNSWGRRDYGGPCPPSGTHRYFFKLYALDTQLSLSAGIRKQELEQAMQDHILAQAELIGLYKKE